MDMTQTWYATAAAAWGCYAFGIWTFRLSRGEPLFLAVAKMALVACPVILSCFGIHATRRYQVILATTQIPVVEIANSDTGRERTIERIECPNGLLFEREYYPGWRTVSADRHRQSASGAVLRGVDASTCCSRQAEGSTAGIAGGFCSCLAVPGCCNGKCEHCWCDPATRLRGSDL